MTQENNEEKKKPTTLEIIIRIICAIAGALTGISAKAMDIIPTVG